MKCIWLSSVLLLEYDELPPAEVEPDFFDWENDNVKEARLNDEKVWLFSACNMPNLIEYIIHSNDSFAQFVDLQDILYPDVGMAMYYSSISGYSWLDGWMKELIDYLIERKELIAFGRTDGLVLEKVNFPDDDELIFAVKACLSSIDENVVDAIIFPEFLRCEEYRVTFDSDKAKFAEEIIEYMSLKAAIAAAISLPEALYRSLKFFSLPSINEQFRIAVGNWGGNVVEIQVSPALEESDYHHYDIDAYISEVALSPEVRYILAQKKANIWPFTEIKDHSV